MYRPIQIGVSIIIPLTFIFVGIMGYRYLKIIEVGSKLWQNTQYLNLWVQE